MQYIAQPEYWLRGPLDHLPAPLQPFAHALMQVRAEVNILLENFPENKLWIRIAGLASPGFHLQHIRGVIDRLFTYARGEVLNEKQMEYLKEEGKNEMVLLQDLLVELNAQVDGALDQLRATDPGTLADSRYVGRKQIPTTVAGLFTHAAEHGMRHVGQLLVTVRLI